MVLEAAAGARTSAVPAITGAAAAGIAVHGHRLSTVVPSSVTGDAVEHELADADLLHKLHYLRAAHVFRAPEDAAAAVFTVAALKEPMFPWLDMYFPVAGRLRRREGAAGEGADSSGRPYVRCNDCGVRVVEVELDVTVDEWLKQEAEQGGRCGMLSYDKVIGPELFFSPLLYVQITSFKCGGIAIGFTWAHVIGDIPSAAVCFRTWAQLFSGKKPLYPTLRDPAVAVPPVTPHADSVNTKALPPSVKVTVAPVGDHWAVPTGGHDMVQFSFHVTEQQLEALQLSVAKASSSSHVAGPFELVSALTWRALAAIRGAHQDEEGEATRVVTVVKAGAASAGGLGLSNDHRIGHVFAAGPAPPAKVNVSELAALLADARLEDAGAAAAIAARGGDVVVYGANLTFVDAGEVDVYGGLELAGRRPAHVEYAVGGVGDGGAVVVHRDGGGGRGRTVAAVVRRGEAERLRAALRDALRFIA